jgi:hypothetical protein
MNQQPVPPNTVIMVKLEAQQWNVVLGALADAPYKVAAPLIQAMIEQFQSQTMGEGVGNGLDIHPPPVPQEALSASG